MRLGGVLEASWRHPEASSRRLKNTLGRQGDAGERILAFLVRIEGLLGGHEPPLPPPPPPPPGVDFFFGSH